VPRVILLGASALNLGLLAPAFDQRGYTILVANRISGSPNTQRLERIARVGHVRLTRSGTEEIVQLELVDTASATGIDRLTDLLADVATTLAVTATRGTLQHFERSLRDAHAKRSTRLPIISAENDPDPWFVERRERGDLPNYEWVDSIADRLCLRFPKGDLADVIHETYGLWVIEGDEAGVLQAIADTTDVDGAVEIRVVPSRIFESYRRRKLWGVNGLHLAIAIMAYHQQRILLDVYLSAEVAKAEARAIAKVLALAISLAEPSLLLDDILAFEESVLFRFTHEQDYTIRVLGGTSTVLPDNVVLQRKVASRLVAPALLLAQQGYEREASLLQDIASLCPHFGG
jgi:hypothetical protein